MCSCRFASIPSALSISQIMGDDEIKKLLMETTIIPKKCFIDNDPEALFLFTWCAAKEDFVNKFQPYFEVKDQNDVKAISKAHKDGKDIEIDKVSYLDLIKDIKIDPTKVNECGISFCD